LRVIRHVVAGEPVVIHRVETEEDLDRFRDFVRRNLKALAVDSEATGLDVFSSGFRPRLVQFGTPREAWVVPVEHGGRFVEDVVKTLKGVEHLVLQNGMFDLQVFDRHFGVPLEESWKKVRDTQLIAKLIDPRPADKGGFGSSLEELTAQFIDADVAENVKGLMTKLAREHKTTKAKIWEKVDLGHPEYNLYAGMDAILAARLIERLLPMVPSSARRLIDYEHQVAEVCSYMERTGFLLDVDYTQRLSQHLQEEEEKWTTIAASYGCENVNSTDAVADVLESRGIRITERTPTGKRKVDKNLLKDLMGQGDEFAKAVYEAKKARKWRTTWVDTFLSTRDENNRCHPSINTLQARTGRMSITGIPAQTLPSGDWIIRRCFVADPGEVIASVDYEAQELRVLAALSGDETMIQAFKEGADLHLMTAQAAFGPHVTKESKERKYAKTVNFGRVYGGGARTVAQQTGLDIQTAKKVVEAFDQRYPRVKQFSDQLAAMAARYGHVTTRTGRRLPVDPDRGYSALNYVIQSTSRDVTCRGILRLHEAGLTPHIRLPIHDEVVLSLPRDAAEEMAGQVGELMAMHMGPVHISTDPTVTGKSWGHEYMKGPDGKLDTALQAQADEEIRAAGLW